MYLIVILDLSPDFLPTSQLHPEDETNTAARWASATSLSGWERFSKDVLYTVGPGRRQMWFIAYQWQSPPVLWQMPKWGQRRPWDWELPQQGLRGGCTQWQYGCPQPWGKYQWHKIWLEMYILRFLLHIEHLIGFFRTCQLEDQQLSSLKVMNQIQLQNMELWTWCLTTTQRTSSWQSPSWRYRIFPP